MASERPSEPPSELQPPALHYHTHTYSRSPLSRSDFSGPDTCHVEDVTQPCTNPNCGMHTGTSTPSVLSRTGSAVDITQMGQIAGAGMYQFPGSDEEDEDGEDDGETQTGTSIRRRDVLPVVSIDEPTEVENFSETEVDQGQTGEATHHVNQLTASTSESVLIPTASMLDSVSSADVHRAGNTNSEANATDPVSEDVIFTQSVDPNITSDSDNIIELQHNASGPDPLETLLREAPLRSSSFPDVPELSSNKEPLPFVSESDDKLHLNQISSEAFACEEALEEDFDLSKSDHGGLLRTDDSIDPLSNESSRQSNEGHIMGCRTTEDIEDGARFEEGLPLLPHHELSNTEEESHPQDVLEEDTVIADAKESGAETGSKDLEWPRITRKSTAQVLDATVKSLTEGETSEILAEPLPTEKKLDFDRDDFFADDKSGIDGDNDFFGHSSETTVPMHQTQDAKLFGEEENVWEDSLRDEFFRRSSGKGAMEEQPVFGGAEHNQALEAKADLANVNWESALEDDDLLDDEDEVLLNDDELLPDPPSQHYAESFGPTHQQNAQHYNVQLRQQNNYLPQSHHEDNLSSLQMPQYVTQQQLAYSETQLAHQNYRHPTPGYGQQNALGAHTQAPQLRKAQSFVDKTEGYASPYDLPLDVVPVARKRPHNISQQPHTAPPPPLRSTSLASALPSQSGISGATSLDPPRSAQQANFFEELPMVPPKPRASSAMGGKYTHTPGHRNGSGTFSPLPGPPPRGASAQGTYSSPTNQSDQVQLSPLQSFGGQLPLGLPTQQMPAPQRPMSRYSPAPASMTRQASAQVYAPPPAQTPVRSRYSPAPSTTGSAPPPPAQSFTPTYATSSAPVGPNSAGLTQSPTMQSRYFAAPQLMGPPRQTSQYTLAPVSQSASSRLQGLSHEQIPVQQAQTVQSSPSVNTPLSSSPTEAMRHASHGSLSSRPGTANSIGALEPPREEEEIAASLASQEKDREYSGYPSPPSSHHANFSTTSSTMSPSSIPPSLKQSQYSLPQRNISSPPPAATSSHNGIISSPLVSNATQHQLSPRKGYQPRTTSPEIAFRPPPRSHTESPGMSSGRTAKVDEKAGEPYERPNSAFAKGPSQSTVARNLSTSALHPEPDFTPPNDESAQDSLQRWKGAPIFAWGAGGNIVTTFPHRSQRFTANMQATVKATVGDVKTRTLAEILPLPELIEKFPGPVWNGKKDKGKKREVLSYAAERIGMLPEGENKMLWQIVHCFIENDGTLEGGPEVEAAVRAIIIPEGTKPPQEGLSGTAQSLLGTPGVEAASCERVDLETLSIFRNKLLSGDRTGAIWYAVDKRLWAHALLMSGTVERNMWKQVVQEFVKSEVKTLGAGSEPIAVLYETLAGNWEESVDELVPQSQRMGMPMMISAGTTPLSVEDRLEKWRETLVLVLANRTPGDQASILALGKLLASYNRVDAAHICYIFARQNGGSIFSHPEDPSTHFSLLGSPNPIPAYSFNLESILLSELYEFGLSLAPQATGPNPIVPHLQLYKLLHAMVLAENGYKRSAQRYCDSITTIIGAMHSAKIQFDPGLARGLENLVDRLRESPSDSKDSSSSGWIPKITGDSVSNRVWGAFNTFVAGGEEEKKSEVTTQMTPDISRSASGVDLFGTYLSGGATTSYSYSPNPYRQQSPDAGRYVPLQSGTRMSLDISQRGPNIHEYKRIISDRNESPMQAEQMGYSQANIPRQQYDETGHQPQQEQSTGKQYSRTVENTSSIEGNAQYSTTEYDPPQHGYRPPEQELKPYETTADEEDDKPRRKNMGMLDEDDGVFSSSAPVDSKLRGQDPAFLAAVKADEERKEAEEARKAEKKSWLSSWFKKDTSSGLQSSPSAGPIKAKLGEENKFVYDPDLKRWVNKAPGAAPIEVAKKPPPPPMRKSASTAALAANAIPPPPPMSGRSVSMGMGEGVIQGIQSDQSLAALAPPRSRGGSPTPVLSCGSSLEAPTAPLVASGRKSPIHPKKVSDAMDDLLGPPAPSRRSTPAAGARKKKGSRYVEVIPGQ